MLLWTRPERPCAWEHREVKIIYRRGREAMPAYAEEIEEALEEGISLDCMVQPLEFLKDKNGSVRAVRCLPMIAGEFDRSGRRRPRKSEKSEIIFEADQVIHGPLARGLISGDLFDKSRPELNPSGFIKADPLTGETTLKGVFTGGDASEGASSVVRAIAAGERAAVGIDQLLTGEEDHAFWRWEQENDVKFDTEADPLPQRREKIPLLEAQKRKHSFDEVEQCWNEETASRQAQRCLRCDYGKKVRVREEANV